MVRLREYYQDPNTPTANDVLPAAFAAVRNSGCILLVRRIDDGNWELPGGRSRSASPPATPSSVKSPRNPASPSSSPPRRLSSSDPTHVLVDPNDTIHQQLALCFHAVPTPHSDGDPPAPTTSKPTPAWFNITEIADLKMHPAMRLRIDNALRASAAILLRETTANQRALRQLRLAQETRPIAPRQDNTGRRGRVPMSPSRAGTRHDYPTVIGHHGRQTTM